MGGAVPPLPQYAFMAWCSVRGSTGTTLPFTLPLPFYNLSVALKCIVKKNRLITNKIMFFGKVVEKMSPYIIGF
jgi:hypothetical protein